MENNKFPTWDETISGIADKRFIDSVYSNTTRYYVKVGARIMYDRLCTMLADPNKKIQRTQKAVPLI